MWDICHDYGFPDPYALFVELDFKFDDCRNFIVKEDNVVLNPSCESIISMMKQKKKRRSYTTDSFPKEFAEFSVNFEQNVDRYGFPIPSNSLFLRENHLSNDFDQNGEWNIMGILFFIQFYSFLIYHKLLQITNRLNWSVISE